MTMLKSIYKKRNSLKAAILGIIIFVFSDLLMTGFKLSEKFRELDIIVSLIWLASVYLFFQKRKTVILVVLVYSIIMSLLYAAFREFSELCFFVTKQHSVVLWLFNEAEESSLRHLILVLGYPSILLLSYFFGTQFDRKMNK